MANRLYYWDRAYWDDSRWATYSALWDVAYWDESYWNLPWSNKLVDIIARMEEENIGTYVFDAGCVEPGVDNVGTPLRRIIANLET